MVEVYHEEERVVFGNDIPWTPFGVTKGLVGTVERDLPGVIGEEWVGRVFWGDAEMFEKAEEESEALINIKERKGSQ